MGIEDFSKKFSLLADSFIEKLYDIYKPSNFIAANIIPMGLKRAEKEAEENVDAVEKLMAAFRAQYHSLSIEFSFLPPKEKEVAIERKKVEIYQDLNILAARIKLFSEQQLTVIRGYDRSLINKTLEIRLAALSKITADSLFELWTDDNN